MDQDTRLQQQQEILRLIARLSQTGALSTSEDVVNASPLSPGTVIFAMGGLLSQGLLVRDGLFTTNCHYRITAAGWALLGEANHG